MCDTIDLMVRLAGLSQLMESPDGLGSNMLKKIMNKFKEILKTSLNQIQKYIWVVSIILSLAAFGFSAYSLKLNNQRLSIVQNYASSGTQVAGSNVDIKKFSKELTGHEPVMGNANAKLTIYEFADFQCPYCKRFFDNTLPGLKQKYIDNGKVKFVQIGLAFLGQESKDAAEAAKCAGDQGQFWAYHDELFYNQQGENQGAFNTKKLRSFAQIIKLNMSDFDQCISTRKMQKSVEDEIKLAQKYNVTSTPTFFINNKLMTGAQPRSVFDDYLKN